MTDNLTQKNPPTQEWSHYFVEEELDKKPIQLNISMPKENAALVCKRLNLYAIESLDAKITLTRNPVTKVIHVKGLLNADVKQYCIITAEPVNEHIKETFEGWFVKTNNAVSFEKARRERMDLQEQDKQPMLEEYDDPEEIIDGKIDLGELVIQHFSLFLTTYPRKEGTVFDNQEESLKEEKGMYDNPFAALKEWKSSEKG